MFKIDIGLLKFSISSCLFYNLCLSENVSILSRRSTLLA